MSRDRTPQQEEVIRFSTQEDQHLMIRARAGTGKTFVLESVARALPARERTITMAFNKENARELQTRVPSYVIAKTFHGLGFDALRRVWGRGLKPNRDRQRQLIERIVPLKTPNRFSVMAQVARATSLAMNALAQTSEEVFALLLDHDIVIEPGVEPQSFVNWVLDTMVASLVKTDAPSFDDMIYVPAALGWPTGVYRNLLVDEGQDTNNAQTALVRNACADNGRIRVFGDDRQALYHFRGAGHGQFDLLKSDIHADERPLTWTFRCPERVVILAQAIVSDYQVAPGADRGEVRWRTEADLLRDARYGDVVISRTNYGCVRVCMALLRRGRRARIVGKNFAEELLRLVDRSGVDTVPALLEWLDTWVFLEVERLIALRREDRADAIRDAAEALREISANAAGVFAIAEFRRTISDLLEGEDTSNCVLITTVHKAKGLEWPRVWLIESTFNVRNTEGENCYYVGVTRARESLFLVSMPQANGRTPGSIARELLDENTIREWEADDNERPRR